MACFYTNFIPTKVFPVQKQYDCVVKFTDNYHVDNLTEHAFFPQFWGAQ